ncbi:TRIM2_3 [Mytilus edulis]|uniref:TRIM2_3 n=1 Tax=Mytilus edulis TaxID=6550 RepID=A0A8S3V1U6_MYTED|nr:TRIM2_3 [Mytilus edulis]
MECHDHHSISKSSKHHEAISIESYKKLPTTITKILTYCHEHDMKYTNYCPHHEKLCCPACIYVDHKSCTDIQLLQHVLKTAKTSALLDSIELSIEDIKSNIKDIIEDRQRNITTIHDQRQIYQHEINQIRNKVNFYIDTLEQNMLKDIDDAENEANAEMEKLIAKLTEKKQVTDIFVQNISAIKKYASDLQAFIGSKSIEAEVEAEEKYLHSLIKDGSLDQIVLRMKIDTKLTNIESIIESFGTVTSETEPPLVVLKSGKDKQAQIMSVVPRVDLISVDEIKLSQISHFTVKEKKRRQPYEIRGITVLPDGRIILADSGRSRLFILNDNGRLDNYISCQSAGIGPFDVTCIKDNEVAISTSRGIHIIHIDSRTILKGIQTSGECRGIAHNNGTLICCVQSKGIQCIQIANQTITTLVEVHESIDQLGICVQRTKIYVTNFSYGFVDCYTLEGKHLWQFHNRSVLMNPTGIAVDNNSNIYVACYCTNSVLVLSSDGKKFKKVLSSRNGLYQPRALHFDEKNSTLLVANIAQPTYMYHVA